MTKVDGKQSTTGVVLLNLGEIAEIDTPFGQIGVQCQYDGREPRFTFDNYVLVLFNCGGPAGTTFSGGTASPAGIPYSLRFRVTSDNEAAIHAVQYTIAAN